MSQENVEVVRRIYDLAARSWGDQGVASPAAVEQLWDPEIVIEENADFPDPDSYHGYDGLAQWWTSFLEIYDEIRFEIRDVLPVGERVVVDIHQWLSSKAGVALEQDVTHVFSLRGGRVVHVTGYHNRSDALAAVGLSE